MSFPSSIQRRPDSSLPALYGASDVAFAARSASSASRRDICAEAGTAAVRMERTSARRHKRA